jgi:Putative zinc-finger
MFQLRFRIAVRRMSAILLTVPARCLARAQIKAIAAGRCTEKELAVVRRHLAECARCRAAVAARAGGVRGPGHTVLMKPKRAPLPTALKIVPVALSVAAVIGAWRYASAPPASTPTVTLVLPLDPPATTAPAAPIEPPPPAPDGSAGTAPTASLPSTSLVSASVPPSLADAGAPRAEVPPAHPRPARPRHRALRGDPTPSAHTAAPKPSDDELDFGIDEAPPPRPMVKGRVIRTTLE